MTSPYTSWMLAFMHFHGRSAELKGSFFSFQLLTPHPVFPALSLNHADDVMCSATSWPVKTFIWLFPQTSLKWQIRPFRASSDSINQTCYLGNRDSLGNSYPHHSLPLGKCGYREWGHQGDRNQARRNWGWRVEQEEKGETAFTACKGKGNHQASAQREHEIHNCNGFSMYKLLTSVYKIGICAEPVKQPQVLYISPQS